MGGCATKPKVWKADLYEAGEGRAANMPVKEEQAVAVSSEKKKEVVVMMVEAGDFSERVKEIVGEEDDDIKVDEQGITRRRSLSLLFKEEGNDSTAAKSDKTLIESAVKREALQQENAGITAAPFEGKPKIN